MVDPEASGLRKLSGPLGGGDYWQRHFWTYNLLAKAISSGETDYARPLPPEFMPT
jgi:hypothetical protein